MRLVAISPNDPLFWLHHSFVDKVWDLWTRRHVREPYRGYRPESGARKGHNVFDKMEPFNIPPFDVLQTQLMGYRYQTDDRLDTLFPIPANPPIAQS
jgi:tyrosinase